MKHIIAWFLSLFKRKPKVDPFQGPSSCDNDQSYAEDYIDYLNSRW